MIAHKKTPRGATLITERQRISHHHILAVAGLSALVALAAIVTPSGDVNATRSITEAEEADHADALLPLEVAPILEAAEAVAVVDSLTREPTPPASQPWEEFIVRSGDNLSLLFKRAGFSTADVYQIVHTAPQGRDLERIYPGQSLAFLRDEDSGLSAVRHTIDGLQSVVYRRMDGGFSSERAVREPEERLSWATVEIESSLFLAGREAGLSSNLIMEAATILGGVIDFVMDPRKGDTMEILYEELYLDGEKYQDGKVVAASYTNRGERFDAYRYVDASGMTSYYNENGVSMRKAFLMAPVDFTRISSGFNPQRKHPIYKTVRPHNGTDYAAPRGTPVFSAGDGRVLEAGYSRANGNYVFIQHGDRYVTKYLHLNQRKVKAGQRVAQSQVIGTVGSTGAATGPHLHYEFLVGGVHRNPRTIHQSLPKAKSLPEGEMPGFRLAIADASTRLAQLREERR
ncbi:MAG: peptidoglycan DD-metalloendopeptidase family protein, partial [Congregibacter sp.]|nr:peptidoglycan DD-metalloendopeptidase family protein [Congregibacter sp.]